MRPELIGLLLAGTSLHHPRATTCATSADPPPPRAAHQPTCGGAYKFVAAAWAPTCECTDPQMVPQSN
eukprot:SAG31_NODE_44338_length_263_cov_0.634146_1_plen_67_part_01